MCAETPLTAGAAIYSAAGVRVEHGARPIIRFPVTGFLRRRSSDGCCRIPACRLLSPGFPPLVSCRWFPAAGFLPLSVCCRVPACRFLSPGFLPQGSCSRAYAAGFLPVGFCRRVSCRWFSAVYFVAAGASAGRAWRDYAFRFVLRSRRIASKFSSAQPINDTRWGMSDSPRGVRVYSTRGGTSG